MTKGGFEIVGAGMAGLLAARMLQSMGYAVGIVENQKGVPNNHSAVLRFRSSIVADVTNIEFKPVSVMRTVQPWRNELADSLAYSKKATGKIALRSSVRENNGMVTRYIAPHDFIPKIVDQIVNACEDRSPFYFDRPWVGVRQFDFTGGVNQPTISTMPMPMLAKILEYKEFDAAGTTFDSVKGYNLNFRIPGIDVYGTVYLPDPETVWNRVSITGDRVTAEYSEVGGHLVNGMLDSLSSGHHDPQVLSRFGPYLTQCLVALGLDGAVSLHASTLADFSVRRQQYQKIMPISDQQRKRFMLWASEVHNVYSLGRFATWRPGLLLDDLVKDVRQIERMAGDGYFRRSISVKA